MSDPYVMPLRADHLAEIREQVATLHRATEACRARPGPTSLQTYAEACIELGRWAPSLMQALDAIRDLHSDSPAGICPSCYRLHDASDTDDGLVPWPCPTLRAMGFEPFTPDGGS